MHVQGGGARLRAKGILLRLLALELSGCCIALVSATDIIVSNVKNIVFLCLHIILSVLPGGYF